MSLRISMEGKESVYFSSSPSTSQEGNSTESSPELLSQSTPEIPSMNLEFSQLRRRSLSASDSGSPTSESPASGSLSARISKRLEAVQVVPKSLTFQLPAGSSETKRKKRPTPPRTLKTGVLKQREQTPRLSSGRDLDRISQEWNVAEPKLSSSGSGSSPSMSRVRPSDYSLYLSVASKLNAEEMKTRPTEHDFPLLSKLAASSDPGSVCHPQRIAEEIQGVAMRPGGDVLFSVCHQVSQLHREAWVAIAKCLFLYPDGVKFLRKYWGLYEQDIPKCARHLMSELKLDDVDHLDLMAALTIMSQDDMANISLPFCKEYLCLLLGDELKALRRQLKRISLEDPQQALSQALDCIYTLVVPDECCQVLSMRREQMPLQDAENKVACFFLLDVIGNKVLSVNKLSSRRKKFFGDVHKRLSQLISGGAADKYGEVHRDFMLRYSTCPPIETESQDARAILAGHLQKMQDHFAKHFQFRTEQCPSPVISTRAFVESESSVISPRHVVENPLQKKVNLGCLGPLESEKILYDHKETVLAFISNLQHGVALQRILIKQMHAIKERNPGSVELEYRESLFFAGLMLDPQGRAFVKRFFEASKEHKQYDIDAFVKSATRYYLDSGLSFQTIEELLTEITKLVLDTEKQGSVLRGVNLSSLFLRELGTYYWGDQLTAYIDRVERLRVEVCSGTASEDVKLGDFLRAAILRLHQLVLPQDLKLILRQRVKIFEQWIGTESALEQAQVLVGNELVLRILNPLLLQRNPHPHVIRLTKILQKLANQSPFNGLEQGEYPELNAAIYYEFVEAHKEFILHMHQASDGSEPSSSS